MAERAYAPSKIPRCYQLNAINRTVAAIAAGQNRVLLVMATGTGKTYTAFQIIHRLWKSPWREGQAKGQKRILFLADRNILIDQTMVNDFRPFKGAMAKLSPNAKGVERVNAQCQVEVEYVGLAVNLRTKEVNKFSEPLYTCSLKQGIEDGFLAPYKVIRVDLDRDTFGWRPTAGMTGALGHLIEDRVYVGADMNRKLVLDKRDTVVAARMRQALSNANADLCATQPHYVEQIAGDNPEGKARLDNIIEPEKRYPVIATTSKLMSTGVDAQTCKLIVLDQNIRSRTMFKQIIGRGTRLREELGKTWFTILDFKRATDNFADPSGVLIEVLAEELASSGVKDFDPFDLLLHVAHNQPPLTRRDRARRLRQRNVFTAYGPVARKVLDALLDKHADEGIATVEGQNVLSIQPFTDLGSPVELIKSFGGRAQYLGALQVLERELYRS